MKRIVILACAAGPGVLGSVSARGDEAGLQPAALSALSDIEWPDVEALRAAHQRRLIGAQPDSLSDGRVEWPYLATCVAHFHGFIEGAVHASTVYQEWSASDPDRYEFARDIWSDPTFPADERDRITRVIVKSREWDRLVRAAEPLVFRWPEPVGMDAGFRPGTMSLRGAPYSLYGHLARTGDIEHFTEFTGAMLGCARASDVKGAMLGRVIANSHRLFAYELTIDMLRSNRDVFSSRQLSDLAETIAADRHRVPMETVLESEYIYMLDFFDTTYEHFRTIQLFRETRPEIEALAHQQQKGQDSGVVGDLMRAFFEDAGLWSEEDSAALPDPHLDLEAINMLPDIFAQIASDDRATADAGIARYEELYSRVEADEVFASERPVFAMTLPAWTHLVDASALVETTRDTALAVIALERYCLEHGEFPPDLEALVPEYMERLPYDRDADGPVVYRRVVNDDGTPDYIMYAIGPDRVDNGGAVPPKHWSSPVFSRAKQEQAAYDIVFTAIEAL